MILSLNGSWAAGWISRLREGLPRGEFFAGLFVIGCASGLGSRMVQSVNRLGWADALLAAFDVSAIVWISCAAGISLVFRDRTTGVSPSELALGAGFVILAVLPIGPLSWVAVAGLSLYVITSTNLDSSRRGAVILLATTVPMLWSKVLFQFFANLILQIDAALVGWMLGTHRAGDIVQFADGSGVLVILPGCSSLANVSLALLCWVTVSRLVCHKSSANDLLWCLLGCMSVIAVNATSISLMGLSQWHYEVFHSPLGEAVSSTIILGFMVGFSMLGVRRELFHRI